MYVTLEGMTMDTSDAQWPNALLPIDVTLDGMAMDESPSQLKKGQRSAAISDGRTRLEQDLNTWAPKLIWAALGMETDESEEQD